jgi:hypothetical protein
LTAAESRILYSEKDARQVSRFVGEIPRDLLVFVRRDVAEPDKAPGPGLEVDVRKLCLGVRVRHTRFGVGYVSYTSGSGKNLKARIRFQNGKVSTFMVSKTPLEILEDTTR